MLILWVKVLHIVAVISWMAGLLYLPRLFVYHAKAGLGTPQAATFEIMEKRLLKIIMMPAMLIVWVTGPWLGWQMGYLADYWFLAKVALVVVMTGMHGMMTRWTRDFAKDRSEKSPQFFRIANEVPTLLMIAIVILVVIKPF
jgi:protoporphyrinogen IX oxidase